MIVLSLFDGISAGRVALERSGIKVDKYYASEIDKYAQIISEKNYPDIIRLGDIRNWKEWDIERPDIIIGGSPCQNFSFAGKRKGMATKTDIKVETLKQYLELKNKGYEFEGQSYLFWEYVSILEHYKPKYFLLENVRMIKDWENIISRAVGIQPTLLNSSLVSAQNRQRNYWTNINSKKDLFGGMLPGIDQPKDRKIYLKDIIEDVQPGIKCGAIRGRGEIKNTEQQLEIRKDEKTNCLTSVQKDNVVVNVDRCLQIGEANINSSESAKRVYSPFGKSPTVNTCQGGNLEPKISTDNITWRKLTPIECERLQTFPDGYTNHVSSSQRYKALGNSWTVDIISHIFNYLKSSQKAENKCQK